MTTRNRNRMKDTETEQRAKDAEMESQMNEDQTNNEGETTTVSALVQTLKSEIEEADALAEEKRTRLDIEITKREAELDELYALRGYGREGKPRQRRLAAKREGGAGRIDWDEKLDKLPKVFTVDDMLKDTQIAAKGKVQCYPAVGRWIKQEKVKQLDRGKWRRIAA